MSYMGAWEGVLRYKLPEVISSSIVRIIITRRAHPLIQADGLGVLPSLHRSGDMTYTSASSIPQTNHPARG